jgi:hypothetical protein
LIKRTQVLDFLGLVGLASWIALSLVTAFQINPDAFQRLGSFGVAVGVAYYGLSSLYHSRPAPTGFHQWRTYNTLTMNEISRSVFTALSNTSILAHHAEVRDQELGRSTPEHIKLISSTLQHSINLAPKLEQESSDLPTRLRKLEEDATAADNNVVVQAQRSHVIELVVVVLATLQWGYGDLVVHTLAGSAG